MYTAIWDIWINARLSSIKHLYIKIQISKSIKVVRIICQKVLTFGWAACRGVQNGDRLSVCHIQQFMDSKATIDENYDFHQCLL